MTTDIETALRAADHAYATNDVAGYFAFFAEDVTILVPGFGRWKKADYVGKWSATVARGGGVEASAIKDLTISVSPSGDAAAASYILDVTYRGLYPTVPVDQRDDKRLLMTEVWFKHDSGWLIDHLAWSTVEIG